MTPTISPSYIIILTGRCPAQEPVVVPSLPHRSLAPQPAIHACCAGMVASARPRRGPHGARTWKRRGGLMTRGHDLRQHEQHERVVDRPTPACRAVVRALEALPEADPASAEAAHLKALEAWQRREGLTRSTGHACLGRLIGRQCAQSLTKRTRQAVPCGLPGADHPTLWLRDGSPRCTWPSRPSSTRNTWARSPRSARAGGCNAPSERGRRGTSRRPCC